MKPKTVRVVGWICGYAFLAFAAAHLFLFEIEVAEDILPSAIFVLFGLMCFLTIQWYMHNLFLAYFPGVSVGLFKPNRNLLEATRGSVGKKIEKRWEAVGREIAIERKMRQSGFPRHSNMRMNVAVARGMIGQLKKIRRSINIHTNNVDTMVDVAKHFGYFAV